VVVTVAQINSTVSGSTPISSSTSPTGSPNETYPPNSAKSLGISLGSGLGIPLTLALLLLGYLYLRERRKTKALMNAQGRVDYKDHADTSVVSAFGAKAELHTVPRNELRDELRNELAAD
jgi:hypothetical protein